MWRVIVNLTPTDAGSRTSDRGPAPSAPRRANLGWGPAAVAVVGLGVFGLGVFAQRHDRPVTSLWFFLLAAQLVLGDLGSAALRGATLSAEGVAFFAISLGAVVASVWLQRRSLLVVGALGCYSFVGYLAFRVFGGTLGFTYGLRRGRTRRRAQRGRLRALGRSMAAQSDRPTSVFSSGCRDPRGSGSSSAHERVTDATVELVRQRKPKALPTSLSATSFRDPRRRNRGGDGAAARIRPRAPVRARRRGVPARDGDRGRCALRGAGRRRSGVQPRSGRGGHLPRREDPVELRAL